MDRERAPDNGPGDEPATGLRARPGLRDAVYALLFMFPAAAFAALVYRFPIPFDGYVRGPAGVWDAMLGALFYGLVGGFVVVPLVAALVGHWLRKRDPPPAVAALVPVLTALAFALALALV